MQKMSSFRFLFMATLMFFLDCCSRSDGGSEGHVVEEMAIFSLIALTFFAITYISFAGRKERSDELKNREVLIRTASIQPFTSTELTAYPVYVWDSRASFHKIGFDADGLFYESSSVKENGIDPAVASTGTWALSSDGKVRITQSASGTVTTYARVSQNRTEATLIRTDSGQLEAWHIGPFGLSNMQASIFGFPSSVETAAKFTTTLVSGRTVYRTTYPGIFANDSGEARFDSEAVCGMIIFNADGTFNKSIDNEIGPTPDYAPTIKGAWHVDEGSGVLTMTVFGYATAATILIRYHDLDSLLVSTTNGTEVWKLSRP